VILVASFEVEALRADGNGTVHRIRAQNAKAAEAIMQKILEPEIVPNPKIVKGGQGTRLVDLGSW